MSSGSSFSKLLLLYAQGRAFETDPESSSTECDSAMDEFAGSPEQGYPFDLATMCISPSRTYVPRFGTTSVGSNTLDISSLTARFQYLASLGKTSTEQADILRAGERILIPFLDKSYSVSEAWLSNVEINGYFDHLSTLDPSGSIANVYSTSSNTLFPQLAEQGAYQQERKKFLNARTIFLPRHMNNHWYLVTIAKHSNDYISITCSDSLSTQESLASKKGSISAHDLHLDFADKFLQALYGDAYSNFLVSKSSELIPRQSNASDCGVAICVEGKRIAQNLTKSNLAVCDYSSERPAIAKTLLDAYPTPERFLNDRPAYPKKRSSNPIAIPATVDLESKRKVIRSKC